MPLPTISDTMRVAMEGHLCNQHKFAQVLHFRKTPAITFAAAIAILDPKLFDLWNIALGGGSSLKSNMVNCSGLEAFRYTPLDNSTATTVITHILNGTVVADPLPANVALVSTFRTGTRGRSFRGRTYMGGHAETTNDGSGRPLAASVTSINTQWTGFIASLVGTGVSLVVASYKIPTATDVATVTTDTTWDTQRRRLRV